MAQKRKKGVKTPEKGVTQKPETVTFDYIKSNFFRVIHCDGIVGGLTPNGWIHMAAWSSRRPFPKQVVHELTSETKLGEELSSTSREVDFIREIEADIVFSPAMAEVIIRWLQKRLAELKSTQDEDASAAKPEEQEEE